MQNFDFIAIFCFSSFAINNKLSFLFFAKEYILKKLVKMNKNEKIVYVSKKKATHVKTSNV